MFSQTLVISDGSLPIYWLFWLLLIIYYCISRPWFILMRCWPIFSSSSESELELEESSRILHTVKNPTLDTLIVDTSLYLLSSRLFVLLHDDLLLQVSLLVAHLLLQRGLLHRSHLLHLLNLVHLLLLHLLVLSKLILERIHLLLRLLGLSLLVDLLGLLLLLVELLLLLLLHLVGLHFIQALLTDGVAHVRVRQHLLQQRLVVRMLKRVELLRLL
jgi:hypothetical protein